MEKTAGAILEHPQVDIFKADFDINYSPVSHIVSFNLFPPTDNSFILKSTPEYCHGISALRKSIPSGKEKKSTTSDMVPPYLIFKYKTDKNVFLVGKSKTEKILAQKDRFIAEKLPQFSW